MFGMRAIKVSLKAVVSDDDNSIWWQYYGIGIFTIGKSTHPKMTYEKTSSHFSYETQKIGKIFLPKNQSSK